MHWENAVHPEEVRLLLRKQRLQLRIAEQRVECLAVLRELEGLGATVQQVRGLGERLLALVREHAALGAVLAGAMLLWRPRRAFRWARRGWLLWLGLRRHQGRLRTLLKMATRLAGI